MKPFFPTTGTEAEWNAAYYRLEDYLRALHLGNKVRQNQIVLELLEAAAKKHAHDPTRNPTTLVLDGADAALERWFARILPEEKRAGVMGYVALLIANGVEKWPMHFLTDEIPPEFSRAMQENDLRAGPDLQVSSMVPRPLDVPLIENFFTESKEETHKGAAVVALITVSTVIAVLAFFFKN